MFLGEYFRERKTNVLGNKGGRRLELKDKIVRSPKDPGVKIHFQGGVISLHMAV